MFRRFSYISLLLVFPIFVDFLVPQPSGILARVQNTDGNDLVASLTVIGPKVEVQRANTTGWVTIDHETLFGVGDKVRTDANGSARITFFDNGTDTTVLPNSEFSLDTFNGTPTLYQLSVSVIFGETLQTISKLLDNGSNYSINSTGLDLAVRGTVLSVRVESSGRSSLLVKTGLVSARNVQDMASPTPDTSDVNNVLQASVPAGFGIRAEPGKTISDIVPATTFQELDAALDGCKASLDMPGDVRINVRLGPGLSFPRVGSLDNHQTILVLGQTKSTNWFRTPFRNGVGWFFDPNGLQIDPTCPKMASYPDNWPGENPLRYKGLDPDVNLTPTATASLTPSPTPTATAGSH